MATVINDKIPVVLPLSFREDLLSDIQHPAWLFAVVGLVAVGVRDRAAIETSTASAGRSMVASLTCACARSQRGMDTYASRRAEAFGAPHSPLTKSTNEGSRRHPS